MSIVALMQDAAESRQQGVTKRGRRKTIRGTGQGKRAATPDKPASQLAAAASELTRYVPTEAIALYTAILPFLVSDGKPLADQSYTAQWILAASVVIVAVLFGVGVFKKEVEKRGESFHWPPKRTLTIVVAFLGWVMVVPGSPFQDFSWFTPAYGAIAGLAITTLLALGNLWFGEVE
jgi:hypothetical protein